MELLFLSGKISAGHFFSQKYISLTKFKRIHSFSNGTGTENNRDNILLSTDVIFYHHEIVNFSVSEGDRSQPQVLLTDSSHNGMTGYDLIKVGKYIFTIAKPQSSSVTFPERYSSVPSSKLDQTL